MEKRTRLVGPKAVIFDIILAIVFFFMMTTVLKPHVPCQEEPYLTGFAMFTSACLTGVFWMAVQCFRVTLVDQLRRAQDSEK